ncbi:unnamed protein product, partial [Durusdinium trenchii]
LYHALRSTFLPIIPMLKFSSGPLVLWVCVAIPLATCCPEPPCNGTVSQASMIEDNENDIQRSLMILATLASQDPALFGGNFLIAVFVFSLMVAGAMYASIMQRWEERSAKHHPASQIVMQGMDEMHFTPDLVVPDGCECILLVPSKPKRGMTFDVIDCAGAVVLRMEDMQHASSSPLPRRRLLTPNKVVLGQCTRTQQSFPSQTSTAITFEISNATHGVFAKLTYEPRQGRDDKVFLETKHEKLLFFGSIEHQTLNLTDFCGRLLATTEPVTQQAHHKQHIPEGKTNQSVQRSRHPNVI